MEIPQRVLDRIYISSGFTAISVLLNVTLYKTMVAQAWEKLGKIIKAGGNVGTEGRRWVRRLIFESRKKNISKVLHILPALDLLCVFPICSAVSHTERDGTEACCMTKHLFWSQRNSSPWRTAGLMFNLLGNIERIHIYTYGVICIALWTSGTKQMK